MLPWLLLAGLGAYVVFGSSTASAAPAPPAPGGPLPPPSPSPVGLTPAPLPTPSSAFGFSGPLGPAATATGPNAEPLAPWYTDPQGLGPLPVPLQNYNLLDPAATSTGPAAPLPTPMHTRAPRHQVGPIRSQFQFPPRSGAQARAASSPSAVTRPLRAPGRAHVGSGTNWGPPPVPQWTADGRAIFRATNGSLRYFGPWPYSGYALDPALYGGFGGFGPEY